MTRQQFPTWAEHSEDILLSLARPIAVVGNGTPRLAWGPVIDKYASVIRINNFKINGFETLVGRRTDVRCTTGCFDIEHRDAHVELTPFTAFAMESMGLHRFNAANARPVLAAFRDVRPFLPVRPSTGLALVQLLEMLAVPADIFGFDGFRTPHYWNPAHGGGHKGPELETLLSRSYMAVYTEVSNDTRDHVGIRELASSIDASWKWLETQGDVILSGQRVLEVGGLSKNVVLALESRNNSVVSVPLESQECGLDGAPNSPRGVLALAFLEPPFDWCVSLGQLDALSPNDIRIFVRQASRLSPRLLLTARADEGGAGGLHSVAWWTRLLSPYYDITVRPGAPNGYYAFYGTRHEQKPPKAIAEGSTGSEMVTTNFQLKSDYTSRLQPAPMHYADDSEDSVGQPDVYRVLRTLARVAGARRVLEIGCGRARRLANLHPEFAIVGMDTAANIACCRADYPFGTWLEADFEQPRNLNWDNDRYHNTVIVCANLIEHLIDPTGLMTLLWHLLLSAPFALLTTPERDLTHGSDHQGPPPDPSHVREWTLSELRRFATASGLDVGFAGLTASRSHSFPLDTSLLVLCGGSLSARQRQAIIMACDVLRGYDALARERDALIRERDAARVEARALADLLARHRLIDVNESDVVTSEAHSADTNRFGTANPDRHGA